MPQPQALTLREQLDKTFKSYQRLSKSEKISDEDKITAAGDALLYVLELISQEEKNNKETND